MGHIVFLHPMTTLAIDLAIGLILSTVTLLHGRSKTTIQAHSVQGAATPLALDFDGTVGDWSHRFSPFVSGLFDDGAVYENLYIISVHDNAKQYRMLATYYRWPADLKTLTFTIRKGVPWSDGQPFDPDDVVFSVMLGKSCTYCTTACLWQHSSAPVVHVILPKLASAAERSNTVSRTFTRADTSIFASLVNSLWIVPKHIWAARRDPGTWTNDHPVGTEPFTQLQNNTSRSFDLAKNPHYWQRGELRIPAFLGDFDATIFWSVAGTSPYTALYNPIMSSTSFFNIGVSITFGANLGRYRNPAADALLAHFRSATDAATQHRAIDNLQALWLRKLPAIPLFPFPIWEAYNTTRYTGFPMAANYYGSGRPGDNPDFELVLLNVHPT